MFNIKELEVFELAIGGHDTPKDGMCAMEAVAWLYGGEFTDEPECACPIIANFVRAINDKVNYDDRQKLIQFLPRLINSRGNSRNEFDRIELLHGFVKDNYPTIIENMREDYKKDARGISISIESYISYHILAVEQSYTRYMHDCPDTNAYDVAYQHVNTAIYMGIDACLVLLDKMLNTGPQGSIDDLGNFAPERIQEYNRIKEKI